MSRLLGPGRAKSPLGVLDGVRALSTCWVVLGHCYLFPFLLTVNNSANLYLEWLKDFSFMFVTSAVFAVDTFFFLSAFLATLLLLRASPRPSCNLSCKYILGAYFRRFWRLTPLLAFTMYFSTFALYPLASGPGR